MPLRIGINALFLIPGGVGGTEIYLRNLLAAFARSPRGHEFVVFLNRETEPIAPTNANDRPDTAIPTSPAKSTFPAISTVSAIPTFPAIPNSPAIPRSPASPRSPAIPRSPALPSHDRQGVVFPVEPLIPNHPSFRAIQSGVKAKSRPRRILYEQTRLPRDARTAEIDVMFNPGFTAPLFPPCPNVSLIHDLQHHHHPEFFKRGDLLAWRFLVWASAKWSKRILTVSEAAREDIHATYGVPLHRIHTAEPGVEPEFCSLQRTGNEPLILCVSTLHPHKNIERLVDAFAAFRSRRPEYRLILAGMRGFHGDAVERRIRHHGLEEQITLTGWIPRQAIFDLYSRAQFAVFPSTFEGFGIPVVEAMAAGVPLIASDIRPITDTAAGTAMLFPPGDTEALTAAMEQFASNPELRTSHISKARERAALYTWDRTAAITLDTLEKAARD